MMSLRSVALITSALTLAFAVTPVDAEAQARRAAIGTNTGQDAAQPAQRAIAFASSLPAPGGALVLPLSSASDLTARAPTLDAADRTAIERALESAEFKYEARATLALRGIGSWRRVHVIGLGQEPDAARFQAAGAITGRAMVSEDGALVVAANGLPAEAAAEFATGLGIGGYRSDLYRTSDRESAALGATTIVSDVSAEARGLYLNRGRALVDAMAWVRDISNEPANVVYPETFVQRTRAAFAGVRGVSIQVLDVPAMERLGMGAILGVGRGSERPPRMLIVRYRGAGAPEGGPIVLAGKGITFDSGGLSIKGAENMGDMKMDMSGAASVTGTVLALARSRAPVNVVAIAALAENMPDGAAIRPGDVLTAMNGKTIEVINTDAEGRLVLADALSWADANLSPDVVVDVATLTGAVRGALGDDYAGLFSRHDALATQLEAAGETVGEPLWRLPLHDSYASDMRSNIADLRNTSTGNGAGAGTGAYFIGEFISREVPWAHLDIANMAYGGANDWKPDGSAAFGVRLLERFVRDYQPIPRGEAED